MPDTGAPWNIPYVAGTDLVADWPTDSQTLAEAIADGLDLAGPAGIGTNAAQAIKVTSFSTTSATYTPVTGLSVSITPTAATSKILVIVTVPINASATADSRVRVVRGATAIGDTSDGSSFRGNWGIDTANREIPNVCSLVILDSPATTSSTTYGVEVRTSAATMYVGLSSNLGGVNSSSITVVEVKA